MRLISRTIFLAVLVLLMGYPCYGAIVTITPSNVSTNPGRIIFDFNSLYPQDLHRIYSYDVDILDLSLLFYSPPGWTDILEFSTDYERWKELVVATWYLRYDITHYMDHQHDHVFLDFPQIDKQTFAAVGGNSSQTLSEDFDNDLNLVYQYYIEGPGDGPGKAYMYFSMPGTMRTGFYGEAGLHLDEGFFDTAPQLDESMFAVYYEWDGTGTLESASLTIDIEPNYIPVPSTMLLLGSGLVGIAAIRRKLKGYKASKFPKSIRQA